MNGAHDLGGMMGFGPIDPEPDEPVFHFDWERRAFALTQAAGAAGSWTLDRARHTTERIPPAEYLSMSYYEKWLRSTEMRLTEHDLVTAEEIAAGRSLGPAAPAKGKLMAERVAPNAERGGNYMRAAGVPQAFAVGEKVRTLNIHPAGHTRLPRYARDKVGLVERVNGFMVFPDTNAHEKGEDPHWNYAVVFAGTELWGADADPSLSVALDLWEPYLERA